MGHRAGNARLLLAAAATLLLGTSVVSAQTATNLRVDGVQQNMHVIDHTPQYCWDYSGAQQNWQIQVDNDPDFILSNSSGTPVPYFWDSGSADKGAANTSRCVEMCSVSLAGSGCLVLDRRAALTYWRLRLQVNGTWGPWVESTVKMNQYPSMPGDVSVVADQASSADPVATWPSAVTGTTYYVSTTGNDGNAGTQAAPFRTVARAAKALSAGDTLLLRGGVYNENVAISASGGYATGQPNRPITVKAYPGETPSLRAVSGGSTLRLDSGITDWVIDGLTIGGSSITVAGIFVNGADQVTIKNCRLDSTLPQRGSSQLDGILVDGNSDDVLIKGCVFDQPIFDQIELINGNGIQIRENEFVGCYRHCIQQHGNPEKPTVIADNYFHDMTVIEGALFLYVGTAGTRVVNNVFSNITGSASTSWAIVVLRSGLISVENNVFYHVDSSAIQLLEYTNFGSYRNNIFMNCGRGILFNSSATPGGTARGAVVDYNIFYNNGTDIELRDSEPFWHPATGNCMGSSCNPLFVNAAGGDFRLQAGSPAIDAGDPISPVPVGGGGRVDIGRFEYGAAATVPYEYQPMFTVADQTPRITWRIHDVDNDLDTLFDLLPPGDNDFQTRYQIQIDPARTFDSVGGTRPLLDSGEVSSQTEGFTVPNSRALPTGDYYVRLRQWDDNDTTRGSWSDHNIRFRIGPAGPQPPYLGSTSPAAGAQGVIETPTITAHVKDDTPGVDQASIRMYVNGSQVTPTITGSATDYTLAWTPPSAFASGATVTVRITAQDQVQTPPGLDTTYSFTIRDTIAPAPPTNVRVIQ